MAKKRVFDNFDPHNNAVENINLAYPVQNFARNSKMVRIFFFMHFSWSYDVIKMEFFAIFATFHTKPSV